MERSIKYGEDMREKFSFENVWYCILLVGLITIDFVVNKVSNRLLLLWR